MVQTSSTYVLAAIAVSAACVAAVPTPAGYVILWYSLTRSFLMYSVFNSGLEAAAKLLEKGVAHVVKSEENKKTHHGSGWGKALINGGANLGSAAIANHQQNQQLQQQQQQQQLQQRDDFEFDNRDFDELEAREPRGGHGGGRKGGKGGKGVQSREEDEFMARRFVFT
jgi:hypothetical protein